MTAPAIPAQRPDFSLVLGGPLFQLFQRVRLSGDGLEFLRRRLLVLSGLTWLPLLLLSAMAGQAVGGPVSIPFLYDVEVHVRFLVALPILVAAEVVVHRRLRPVVAKFVQERIVVPEDLPASTRRSPPRCAGALAAGGSGAGGRGLHVGSLGLATAGRRPGRGQLVRGSGGGQMRLTPAGRWYLFVSVPLFQLILLRWYFRFFVWFWFLWRVSTLNLRLRPLHPDRAAGLGFLGNTIYAFAPVLVAQGALVAGQLASLIFYAGRSVMAFKVGVVAFVVFLMASILGPLGVFAPNLWRARRDALAAFGSLAGRCVEAFEEAWLPGGQASDRPLPVSADTQTLADLGSAYRVIQETRVVPFGWREVTWLAAAAAMPFLPLMLTVFSVEDLVDRLLNVLL